MKADDIFVLAVLRADQKLDSRALQRLAGARKLRFATREELAALTGGLVLTRGATGDECFMNFVSTQGASARWVTSVCTGALILGTAGLLDGYRATMHCLAIDVLRQISKEILVVNGYPRWEHDRNRLTGGGVSSSLDSTLYLISLLTNEQTAKCIQLVIQYNPQPPFRTGDPSIADTETYLRVVYGITSPSSAA